MDESKQFIGNYQVLKSLGKGGMGEVFLVQDPFCDRNVALKQIRKEWVNNKIIQERFLREARVAAQLSHPSIIAIYTINHDEKGIYYTMPYIEGETLKSILRTTREQEKKGEALHPIGASISSLVRIFLNIAEAIAYSHSKGIIHRDLKPENIIVGKYGEVIILDWGLADFIKQSDLETEEIIKLPKKDLTRPGAIAGTLSYMAPERAFGQKSSILTDIYSLGVMLYQLLTLRLPFHRANLQEFRKQFKHEQILDPEEIAPNREISPLLSEIAKKCLAPIEEQRYQTVDELTSDLEKYIAGLPEWTFEASLQMENKEDWEFQENLLLAKHIAISRQTDVMEWVSLMISKQAFTGNIKIQTSIHMGDSGQGIGFLLSLTPNQIGKGLLDGYCLWIGSSSNPGARLYRSNVELMYFPDIHLAQNQENDVRIEMIDHHLRFYLGNKLKIGYLSHLPMIGNRIGLLFRDADFRMKPLEVFIGSQNVMVNCLAVPDALVMHGYYKDALLEYRKIAKSFPGRAEGREAIFRAGIALLEEAQEKKKPIKKKFFIQSLDEFGKLHSTPGAPLEYYGKSLVYKIWKDIDEEIKCLELAIRKFSKHPLKPILIEHIITRMHESARNDRIAAYHFALLALRHLPHIFSNLDNQMLLDTLKKHLEPLFFLTPTDAHNLDTAVQLAFWLNRPMSLVEMIDQEIEENARINALYALIALNHLDYAQEKLSMLQEEKNRQEISTLIKCIKSNRIHGDLNFRSTVSLCYHFLDQNVSQLALKLFEKLNFKHFSKDEQFYLIALQIFCLLLKDQWKKAGKLFQKIPSSVLSQENHPIFFIYGCYLIFKEGKSAATLYLKTISETTSYPPTSLLLSHYLLQRISLKKSWYKNSFFWEKLMLYRELFLYFHCVKNLKMKASILKKLQKKIKKSF